MYAYIEMNLGIVKQQAVDTKTEAQNAQTDAQNANTTATDAKTIAQEALQQAVALTQEVNTLKSLVEAQKLEIDSLQIQVKSTMNQYKFHFQYDTGWSSSKVSGLLVTLEGLGTFTTDSNGDFLVYVPVKDTSYNLTVGGGYKIFGTYESKTKFVSSGYGYDGVHYPIIRLSM